MSLWASLVAQIVKNPLAIWGRPGFYPGLGRSLEREWLPTPVSLAWRMPWTEEPGGLQSMGSLRVGRNRATSLSHIGEMATHSSVLAWRIPGTGEPGGLPCMELHRVGHD